MRAHATSLSYFFLICLFLTLFQAHWPPAASWPTAMATILILGSVISYLQLLLHLGYLLLHFIQFSHLHVTYAELASLAHLKYHCYYSLPSTLACLQSSYFHLKLVYLLFLPPGDWKLLKDIVLDDWSNEGIGALVPLYEKPKTLSRSFYPYPSLIHFYIPF